MRRFGKWVAGGLAAVVLLAAVALVAVRSVDLNRYRGSLEAAAEAATGRDLTIEGDLTLTLALPPAVVVERVSLANAPGGSRAAMLVVDRARMEFALLPLLQRTLRIERLAVDGVDLRLERNGDGVANWQFKPQAAEASAEGGMPVDIRVREVDLARVRWTYRGRAAQEDLQGNIASLKLSHADPGAPITFTLNARIGDEPVVASGSTGTLRALLADEAFPLALKAEGLGMNGSVDGSIARPLSWQGIRLALALAGRDVQAAAKRAGLAIPPLPAFDLAGQLSDAGGGYLLSDVNLKLGQSDAAGDVRVDLAPVRPNVTASLAAQQLDAVELAAIFDDESAPADADPRLPFASLRRVDATIGITASRVVLQPEMTAEDARLEATLAQGKLTAAATFGRLLGGSLSVRSTLDAASQAMSVQVLSEGVELGALLSGLHASNAFEGGPLTGRVELAGSGETFGAWLAGVNGRTDVVIGPARQRNRRLGVIGADLVTEIIRTVNPFVATEETTPIECGVVRSRITRGRMTFDRSLAVETDRLGVIASGSIDLPSEAVNVVLRSAAREGLGISVGGIVAMFVRIGGTLDHPTLRADPLGGIADIAGFARNLVTDAVTLDASGIVRLLGTRGDYCQVALGRTPSGGKPFAGIGSAVEGAVEGIGRRLEGLFGE